MPKTPAKAPSPVADFETALAQLETLVESMEGGEMTLEDSLGAYERGVALYRSCQQALEQAKANSLAMQAPQPPAFDPAEPTQEVGLLWIEERLDHGFGRLGRLRIGVGVAPILQRARDLLDEIRRRSGQPDRPQDERDYLGRLLDRF